MPFISEAASALKSRFGFHNRSSSSESVPAAVPSTPDLLNYSVSLVSTSAVRSIPDLEDDSAEGTTGLVAPPQTQSFEFSEDPSFWKDHNVQVIIRIRPLSSSEISLQGYSKCVKQESCQTITWTGHPESRFTFDLVADEAVSQEKLFKVAGMPMVDNCVGGYNSCMFAYGQTGSGKTHTMLGDIEGGTRRHSVNCGMTPRVFEYLFSRIQKEKEARKDEKIKYTCKCSFLEIYNEQILDLLDPSTNNLQIREDVKKGVYVENLKEIEVTSARDVIQQLIQGSANRKVAATNMNRASSRSHSVFTCIIESKWESQGVTHHRFARLNLVDLAGSERQKSSGAEGERLKEATNINKSLSTLGLVIMNLVSISNGKSQHVPYRDSKLTFLLQDSLGGNSKTTIIANISPSICCSLETLSTLKFAQRAKFIKNNAIVNEDASGDVIAMRMQIQQLKKEVSRLRSLANGGAENLDNDSSVISFPGSPGSFNWEGLHGSFSPLVSGKRMSQKKDYDIALVGAFKREKDKDIALKALAAENQTAIQLAKQRADEIQGLKMRLRFREAGIKRLEVVACGKISAETHLLKEREEHLKELEVLRTRVDRNQEVTRFAMENLRLKEEIRRLKSFYEEGEREMMNEQIMVLQNKLLEALDWKLMHESDPFTKTNLDAEVHADPVISNQEAGTPWRSSINEENEFLRMQAIQNQAEIDTLHKQLGFCFEEKEKLQRHANDLLAKLEEERSLRDIKEETSRTELPILATDAPVINIDGQMELKTMVDAIAAASQREAEAHEKAIILSKENDDLQKKLEAFIEANTELQTKLKALIEEKNSLIEMYERAASESNYKTLNKAESTEENDMEIDKQKDIEVDSNGGPIEFAKVKESDMETVVKNLEHQLMEMHEENDKLMGLYEKAMHERDEFKRMLFSSSQNRVKSRELDCPEKLVEVDGGEYNVSCSLPSDLEANKLENSVLASAKSGEAVLHTEAVLFASSDARLNGPSLYQGDHQPEEDQIGVGTFYDMETDPSNLTTVTVSEDLKLVQMKLETAEDKVSDSVKTLALLGLLEKAFLEFDKLWRKIEAAEEGFQVKQQDLRSLQQLSSEIHERKTLTDKKLSALKFSLSSFCQSVNYFEQREARARARVNASSTYLDEKKHELAHLLASKREIEAALGRDRQTEAELRNNHTILKSKLEEENRRKENEKILFAIDNVEKLDISQKNWHIGGKATDLLKSEEEKIKLQAEIKLSREKLGIITREIDDLSRKSGKIDNEIQAVKTDIQKGSRALAELELALQGVVQEKETLLEMGENGICEIQDMILEYQQNVFDKDLKEEEIKTMEEELLPELRRLEELRAVKTAAAEKMTKLLEETTSDSSFLSQKLEAELQNAQASILEAKTLLLVQNV
ncbi:kinesin-like protein KIN-12E isoform X2 [Ricinus communis]|uniref:kinesin-like protein KIN-12E isoform X2 n=1 Tax=Ricinus communis TaxID=3988 RepID=UPI00201A635E|nr:kinesin-like protein KIN-12E isoform X2 [Ricinus communis]